MQPGWEATVSDSQDAGGHVRPCMPGSCAVPERKDSKCYSPLFFHETESNDDALSDAIGS